MANIILWNSFGVSHTALRPLGAHQIAAWLTQHGYSVEVIDFCHAMTTAELVNLTERSIDSSTVAIGVSSTFWTESTDSGKVEPQWIIDARALIEQKHTLDWILGGAKSMFMSLKLNWIRFHGHAEDSLLGYMDQKFNKVVHRDKFDIVNLKYHYIDNLHITKDEVLSIELGRGCQFKCSFCRYPLIGKKKGTYIRDMSHVKYELLSNYERYGTTRYFVTDDTANESEEKIEQLADLAQSLPFKLEWIGYLRLDLIGSRPNTIQILKDSGLKGAFFGIESFHKDASRAVGKGWNGVKGKDFLLQLKKEWNDSILLQLGFIVGLPGETASDIMDTYNWCVNNDIGAWNFHPLHIERVANRAWSSEFDRNYFDYGYSFPRPLDNEFWKNDLWTRDSAKIASQHLDQSSFNHSKNGVWRMGELATLGYAFDDIIPLYKKDVDMISFERQTKDFVQQYIKSKTSLG